MDPRVAQGPDPVPRVDQRLHEADGEPGVQGIERGEPPPPRGGPRMIATVGRRAGQPFERLAIFVLQGTALGLRPAVELAQTGQPEPVEKGAGVQGCRVLQATGGEGGAEVDDVG